MDEGLARRAAAAVPRGRSRAGGAPAAPAHGPLGCVTNELGGGLHAPVQQATHRRPSNLFFFHKSSSNELNIDSRGLTDVEQTGSMKNGRIAERQYLHMVNVDTPRNKKPLNRTNAVCAGVLTIRYCVVEKANRRRVPARRGVALLWEPADRSQGRSHAPLRSRTPAIEKQ
ncbi:hypothetical protein EVAR_27577_1 [Eumeta japonica]|uniref:Uncharacterized protein n=1 Tax=Eumeta variegata TaxID=151549 RepID=A0A4C1WBB1_EUMVA|nr:hypothetical protein EVAR_27577_1 [Eumeta japonica]